MNNVWIQLQSDRNVENSCVLAYSFVFPLTYEITSSYSEFSGKFDYLPDHKLHFKFIICAVALMSLG